MLDASSISLFGVAGFLGVVLYLGAYAALQAGLLRGQGYAYALLNAAAAGLVLVSLKEAFNLSSAVIQITWIIISLGGVARHYILTHRVTFTDEEQAFIEEAVPNLETLKARRLLDLAVWRTGTPATVLTEAGKPVEELVYLADGRAEVVSDGTVIATVEGGSFIGEMSFLTDEPAAATVVLATSSRYMSIPNQPLGRLVQRDAEIRKELESSMAAEVSRRLASTSRDLAGEMRRHRHLPVRLPLTLAGEDGPEATLHTEDISRGGFFVPTDAPKPLRELLEVELTTPTEPRPLRLLAVVAYAVTPEEARARERSPGMGLNLYALDPLRQRAWDSLVGQVTAEYDRTRDIVSVESLTLRRAGDDVAPRLEVPFDDGKDLHKAVGDLLTTGRVTAPGADKLPPGTTVEVAFVHPEHRVDLGMVGRVSGARGEEGAGAEVELVPPGPQQREAVLKFPDTADMVRRLREGGTVRIEVGDPLLA